MTILVVTDLYPSAPDGDLSASALHRFCRVWSRTETVHVMRPRIVPRRSGRDCVENREWDADGVRVASVRVAKFPFRPWFHTRALERELERIQPDVVVGHLGFNLEFAARLAEKFEKPLVAGVHMGDLVHGPRMLGEKRLGEIFAQAARIAARSPAVRRRFVYRYPRFQDRCRTAWSGLGPSGYLRREAGPEKMIGLEEDRPLRLMTACQLVPLKGVDITLRALARLGRNPRWVFTVAGDGPERKRLERLAGKLGISARVRFTGHLDRVDLRGEMAEAHFFVMVSAPETFGLVYLEAMAAGCLVVGARGHGIDGIVAHGRNGWLCNAGDVASQTALLGRIMGESPRELARVAANARRTVEFLTEERAGAGYLKIIHEALEQVKAP